MNPPEYVARPGPQSDADPPDDLLLGRLNPRQREAVTHPGGAMLVLAGAGSGKTRVITHRIAYLIRHRAVDPRGIVAVTFTNKAAGEMRDRVERLLGGRPEGTWIGTFHAFCLRLLRRAGQHVGVDPGFNVYDTDDQLAVVRRILREEGADDATSSARPILAAISRAKNAMESPEGMLAKAWSKDAKLRARVYAAYDESLRRANAVDFDDLLLRALDLFDAQRSPEILDRYASRCEHLLVDEYQDTNRPQYLLVRALSSRHGNVCVVGDEDQSIYRFRGAEIRNILEFEQDHPGALVIRLEQNYRSTGRILDVAGSVISNNVRRKGKTLWTENDPGEKIALHRAPDDRTEAAWIAARIRELAGETGYDGMAVLYRTNAQSRQIEEILRRDRIPYQVVGSVGFYQRKEVKDLLAYLKLLANPADDVSFARIVNTPPRGIGETTLKTIEEAARSLNVSRMEACAAVIADGRLPGRISRMVERFVSLIGEHARRATEEPVAVVLDGVMEATRFEAYLEKAHRGEGLDRLENVRALVSATVEYEKEPGEHTLQGFLDRTALVSDADEVGARPGVTLMTIHVAKGLEFPVVFLAGLEENLFPHARSVGSEEDLEEERRLCYVAMTRAKSRLLLSHALVRLVQGVPIPNPRSRFLSEIPAELVEEDRTETGYTLAEGQRWNGYERNRSGGSSAARVVRRQPVVSPLTGNVVLQDAADGFPVGATVEHPMFGAGRVLDREGAGKTLKLTIHFVGYGPKKILPAYTKLQVASNDRERV